MNFCLRSSPCRLAFLLTGLLFVISFTLKAEQAETIHIAVASNFTVPMKALVAKFEQASAHKVQLSFGSSGKFYAQIRHGAPYQVFFSADQAKPKALAQANLVVPNSQFTYALGALALWSSKAADVSLTRLQSGDFNKLALANPKLAPYGRAALDVLNQLKLQQTTRSKWVMGENIAQAYQFVATGNADLGFVALSQVLNTKPTKNTNSDYWLVPSELYRPIRQDAILLARGATSKAAQEFIAFVRSPIAVTIIEQYGYQVPKYDDSDKS